MLSQATMVAVKKAIERMYAGTCTIFEYQKVRKTNGSTGFQEVKILENQPCKLSFERITNVNQSESASSVVQITKLFISPDIQVKPGSKLTITQNGLTTEFKNSGQPAIYNSHQEIVLELFDGWS